MSAWARVRCERVFITTLCTHCAVACVGFNSFIKCLRRRIFCTFFFRSSFARAHFHGQVHRSNCHGSREFCFHFILLFFIACQKLILSEIFSIVLTGLLFFLCVRLKIERCGCVKMRVHSKITLKTCHHRHCCRRICKALESTHDRTAHRGIISMNNITFGKVHCTPVKIRTCEIASINRRAIDSPAIDRFRTQEITCAERKITHETYQRPASSSHSITRHGRHCFGPSLAFSIAVQSIWSKRLF